MLRAEETKNEELTAHTCPNTSAYSASSEVRSQSIQLAGEGLRDSVQLAENLWILRQLSGDVAVVPYGDDSITAVQQFSPQLTIGSIESYDENGRRQRGEMETTISRRCADLVDQWLS